jgi:hypothetical protein
MSQVRRVNVDAREKDRMSVNINALIVVQPGVLTRDEVDAMRRTVASRLMLFMANEVPYLNVHLSDIKVKR